MKGIHISGDLILAPGVKGNVTLTDTSVSGSIRNYGTGQVVFAESKPCLLYTSHYNYVGDSILGYKAHMGAGSITSNVKSDKLLVVVKDGAEQVETGRKKVGAMLGDRVEVGCNSVLNPGTRCV